MTPGSIRRSLMAAIACIGFAAALPQAFAQQRYPGRPITMIVPFAPGNVTDSIARLIADRLSQELGQAVVVENKAGASGGIGMAALGRAAPDGYTIGLSAIGPLALNPALYPKLPYDAENGFSMISVVYRGPIVVLVDPRSPYRSLKDLIEQSKRASIEYATPGAGSSQHLTAELLQHVSGARLVHVPNRGSGQAAALLLGNHVPVLFEVTSVAVPYVRNGQMRALAISSAQRLPALPDVPTVAESGYPEFSAEGWLCVVTPAGVPAGIQQRLADAVRKVMRLPEVQAQIANFGGFAESMSPAQSTAFVHADTARWGELIRSAGIKLE
ncbi:Argininosuccinate lyase (plasmid) [Variovorax sp. SRS16]|uniref:Bug family tripartite tricarboxylate transporter substrate binding protein n=1 Tax=Variovorax sp. SRS16 TaxID=282217 RepID=UPI001318AFE6|nr:tripartite tricarboxylate transporter substrate binding protein [Variovorax sp. SRS16]VTU46502.1 Argininosuccinate lyase [Variovorax sp. SRS16]